MKTVFLCTNCGYQSSKWLGRCPDCGSWNSLAEEVSAGSASKTSSGNTAHAVARIESLQSLESQTLSRLSTGVQELDRVLGGLVPGQTVLISGEPGVGKSTLILTVAGALAASRKVLYVNGEESGAQVKIRAERMGIRSENLFLCPETNTEALCGLIEREKPDVLFVDSIQTMIHPGFSSVPGSMVQTRETAFQLVECCKRQNIPLFLVAHVTKDGSIAGPKILEHMVDTVLFFESDNRGLYRVLRSLKNRFFSTTEVGLFEMMDTGLAEIEDPSGIFRFQHVEMPSGVAYYGLLEGNRAFAVEIQALCVPTRFQYPRRTSDGADSNRVFLLAAILEKNAKVNLSQHDLFLNVTSGLRIEDPSLDLAAALAIVSSYKEKPLPAGLAIFGELGLAGEVRPVRDPQKRAMELKRMGYSRVMLPAQNRLEKINGLELAPVETLAEAVTLLF